LAKPKQANIEQGDTHAEKNGKNHYHVSAPANIATANMTKILALDFICIDIQSPPRFCLFAAAFATCCLLRGNASRFITHPRHLVAPCLQKTPQKSRKPQFEYFGTEKWFKCAGYPIPIT
jgi:hypothetical protein